MPAQADRGVVRTGGPRPRRSAGTTLDSVMPGRTRNPTTVLAAGALTSGILAYGFFAVSTRALGAELAAPVSVLWTYWSFSAACLTFPLQHWIARTRGRAGRRGRRYGRR